MPITTLDPNTALVVIDLQHGLVALPAIQPISEIVAQAAKLARAFRSRGAPVVLVNAAGGALGRTDLQRPMRTMPPEALELMPELDHQPSDILITKLTWGAFHGTALDMQLRRRAVTQIVLCGVATSIGVESTARAAFEHGYNVTLAIDAMTDLAIEPHRNSIERIFPRLGETGTTDDVIRKLGA